MEWQKIIETALASTPQSAILGFAVWRLWLKVESKDAEIRDLNAARVKDLIHVVARGDD